MSELFETKKKDFFDADETKRPVTLSVCLIVKDEERVLGRCLSAAVQFADELIVLDTGSKDRSIEIAGEYTDLVFSEPWQDSFAKARNFAASKAGCDYVMWLDADDVIDPDEIRKLLQLKKRLTHKTDVVFMTYRNYGFLSDIGLRDRIHRREYACSWEGDVHEAIRIGDDWNKMLCPEITVVHKKECVNEPDRNIRIFNGVKRAGKLKGTFMLSFYCRELALHNNKDKALEAWDELLMAKPSANQVQHALTFLTGMLLRQKEYEKCRSLISTSVEQYGVPMSAFFCYCLGLSYEGSGDIKEAQTQYRLATEIPVNITTCMIEFAGYDNYLPFLKLCALAYDSGNIEESEFWNNRAGEAWPEGRAWRINRERFFSSPLPPGREPLISVIMTACDEEAYNIEAVSSILDQSWQNFELIIVDDASMDSTQDIILSFSDPRIRLLRNDHKLGNAASRNHAISVSGGEYFALMDASGISLPDRLKAQVTFLENNRETMILGTSSLMIDHDGKIKGSFSVMPGSPKYYKARLLLGKPEFHNSTVMIRKSFLVDNDLSYREGFTGMEDYRLFMEASKLGAISCLADCHYHYRSHGNEISAGSNVKISEEHVRIYNRIRCDSLHMSGVRLSEEDELLLNQLLPEDRLPIWSRWEREKLTDLFVKIREQLVAEGFTAIRELDEVVLSILNH